MTYESLTTTNVDATWPEDSIIDVSSIEWAWTKIERLFGDEKRGAEVAEWREQVHRAFRAVAILAIAPAHEKRLIPWEVKEVIATDIWQVQVVWLTPAGWAELRIEKGYTQTSGHIRLVARTDGAGDDYLLDIASTIARELNRWSLDR